jgi:hypothetical protein
VVNVLNQTVLSGDYQGKRVMIRVESPEDFVNAPFDKVGRVHYIDHLKGVVQPFLARRGDILNIRIEGQAQ